MIQETRIRVRLTRAKMPATSQAGAGISLAGGTKQLSRKANVTKREASFWSHSQELLVLYFVSACFFRTYFFRTRFFQTCFFRTCPLGLISQVQIARVNLLAHVIENDIVAVRQDDIACCLEHREVVHDVRAAEFTAIF